MPFYFYILAVKKQLQPGPVDTGIIHTLHEDGTVTFTVWYEDLSGMGNDTSEDIASGWYCRIGDRVFEFFPSIPAYVIEPERENVVFIYPRRHSSNKRATRLFPRLLRSN